MNIEEVDKLFLDAGFKKIEDPMFFWEFRLTDEESTMSDFDEDNNPAILYGDTGVNKGFCLYVADCYIWLNVTNPKEAVEFASNLKAVEYLD
jgi:hypothetical protein